MKKIKVDINKLDVASKVVGKQATTYKKLYKQINTITNSNQVAWSGQDQKAFAEKIDQLEPRLEKIYKTLESYEDLLHNAANIYSNSQQKVINKAKSLL
jgi:WXG100 family type VII secretion target